MPKAEAIDQKYYFLVLKWMVNEMVQDSGKNLKKAYGGWDYQYKSNMRKYSCYLMASLTIVLLLSNFVCCSGGVKARLGEEFSLHIGESTKIAVENLGIKFIEVSEDSRCARDITCIWEGRVTAVVELSMNGSFQRLELSQPGLTDAPAREIYEEYELIYRVEPYPEKADVETLADEYQLLLIVKK